MAFEIPIALFSVLAVCDRVWTRTKFKFEIAHMAINNKNADVHMHTPFHEEKNHQKQEKEEEEDGEKTQQRIISNRVK